VVTRAAPSLTELTVTSFLRMDADETAGGASLNGAIEVRAPEPSMAKASVLAEVLAVAKSRHGQKFGRHGGWRNIANALPIQ